MEQSRNFRQQVQVPAWNKVSNRNKSCSKVYKLEWWIICLTVKPINKRNQKRKQMWDYLTRLACEAMELEHLSMPTNQEWKILKNKTQSKTLVSNLRPIPSLNQSHLKELLYLLQHKNNQVQMPKLIMLTSNVKLQMPKPSNIVYNHNLDEWKIQRAS